MNLKRQLSLFYTYELLGGFTLYGSVSILLLLGRGFTLLDFGIAEAVFHATSLLFEVPSGMIADLYGRRKTLFASQICFGLSAAAMILSRSLLGICLSYALCALGYNLMSGSKEAILYDSLQQCRTEADYLRISGNREVLYNLSSIGSSLCAGIAQTIGYLWSYGVHIVTAALCGLAALLMKEPAYQKPDISPKVLPAIKAQWKSSLVSLRTAPDVAGIMITQSIIACTRTLSMFYLQQQLSQTGASGTLIGIAFVITNAGGLLAAKAAPLLDRLSWRGVLTLCGMGCGGSLALGALVPHPIAATAAGCLLLLFETLCYLQSDARMQHRIASDKRATVVSFSSLLFSLMMLPLSPVTGWVADTYGVSICFLVLGGAALLVAIGALTTKAKKTN